MNEQAYRITFADRKGFAVQYGPSIAEKYKSSTVAINARNYGERTNIDVRVTHVFDRSSRRMVGCISLNPAQSLEFACQLLTPKQASCARNADSISGLLDDTMRLLDKCDPFSLTDERAAIRARVLKFIKGESCAK